MNPKVAIVGAGISGLACALRLHALDPTVEITIFEREDRAGGKILTETIDGFMIEAGPDAFLASKRGGVSLSHELGLDDQFVSPNPDHRRSFVLSRGQLRPLPQGLSGLVPSEIRPLLRSRILSPAGKARLAMDLATPPRSGSADESLASFIRRRLGAEVYERMIEPLLSGIYAGDGERLSLAATFPQLRAAELTHGGIIRGALAQKQEREARQPNQTLRTGFLSFEGGMQVLVDRALQAVRRNGAQVRCAASCSGIGARANGEKAYQLSIVDPGGERDENFDAVALAVPAWAAAPLLAGIAPTASDALARIEHVSNALVAVAFPSTQIRHALDGYGYIVPRIEGRQVMAMTWITSKWKNRAPKDQVLVRAFIGRAGQDLALQGDDDSLVALTLQEIREVLSATVEPTMARVYRWDRGMPQYTMGHLERIDQVESELARLPGVEIAGNYLRGVGIPDSITSGETAAANLLAELRQRSREDAAPSVTAS